MRDIAVTLAVFGSLPFILKRPWIGILVWTWLGFMNPHRMAWGFSTTMPFAYIVALTTFTSMIMHRVPKRIPWERETVVLALFIGWMLITTINALFPAYAWEQFEKIIKIQVMIFVAMMLITTEDRLKWLVWVIAISIGVYGLKGGIFTIIHGGAFRVQGPPGTFIEGNNELGLAVAMTVPLLYFLARNATPLSLRPAVYAITVLNAIGAIGTQSRGAMVGMAIMGLVFWFKSRQKFMVAILGALSILVIAQIMPEEWYDRMNSIKTYQDDGSAQGRINAWWTAFNVAKARITGGGFETFQPVVFQFYAPNPNDVHDVHSIYFEALGEHGFPGLFLFLLLALLTWRSASSVRKAVKGIPERLWWAELATMVQVSLVAYLVAGAFLGMAYFDYYYNLVLIVVVMKVILRREGLLRNRGGVTVAPPSSKALGTSASLPPSSARGQFAKGAEISGSGAP
ncbi:putative O-glycosylation ligase, exosortase A system-associated [Thauera sp. 2A1]|uniref:putative O-glycosylation ligase, exosortase A system-associated n=1 Tax=Thauera sp. 2A1 TaxID=2570191 RepID=UPI00129162D8|nr:putative O-glycosylation ligase, exosortase A system-associated [Thauera sp. 2A1]KAI5916662.1 putative O-glycosylation ligase, exosortase A system-associated [Thauera sp. 2A1]